MKKHSAQPESENSFGGFLRRLRSKLQKQSAQEPPQKIISVAIMPRNVGCFGGKILFNLPGKFKCIKNTKTECVFLNLQNGLTLTVSAGNSGLLLQSLTEEQFRLALTARLIPPPLRRHRRITITQFQHSFVKHSPTLTVHYSIIDDRSTETTVLYQIQSGEQLYSLLFTGINLSNELLIASICTSVSLQHHNTQESHR